MLCEQVFCLFEGRFLGNMMGARVAMELLLEVVLLV